MTRAQFLHRALHQLLGVGELLEDERDVHLRLAGKPLAPAIDAVLSHEREGVGEQIQRDGEPPTRGTHHRLVAFERVAMLIVNRHKVLSAQCGARPPDISGRTRHFLGFDGRSSTRLGRLRGSCRSTLTTTSATSSGAIFQSAPLASSPLEKLVATDPGMTQLTRMSSYRTSCISASLNAFNPDFDAQYAAPSANGFLAARLLMLMMNPPPRRRRCGSAA